MTVTNISGESTLDNQNRPSGQREGEVSFAGVALSAYRENPVSARGGIIMTTKSTVELSFERFRGQIVGLKVISMCAGELRSSSVY
jgi:hypothetical protein